MGVRSWIGHISEQNSVLVDILLDQGAILHCRTNVSQALMYAEAENYVYGRTLNPFNRTLTWSVSLFWASTIAHCSSSGGSSGGEGPVVALGGSAIGVGTDLGGSVRIPAACKSLVNVLPAKASY